jgi:hypothetical protein
LINILVKSNNHFYDGGVRYFFISFLVALFIVGLLLIVFDWRVEKEFFKSGIVSLYILIAVLAMAAPYVNKLKFIHIPLWGFSNEQGKYMDTSYRKHPKVVLFLYILIAISAVYILVLRYS